MILLKYIGFEEILDVGTLIDIDETSESGQEVTITQGALMDVGGTDLVAVDLEFVG